MSQAKTKSPIQKSADVKKRDSNLELYRIITMILIVAHHYVVNSGLTDPLGPIYQTPLSFPSIFLLLFGAWGKTGINCFVLITGYFMCKSNITAKKFVKLLFEVEFYKIIFYVIFLISGHATFSAKSLLKAVLPFTSVATGFVGCYLLFFLCIPFLNILVRNMNEKQHIRLSLLVSFIYVLFGTLPFVSVSMNYVSWFIVLYFFGSYIRLYPKKLFDKTALWGLMTLVSLIISAASVVGCAWLGTKLGRNMAYFFVTDSNTFLAVATGICSFMFFKNLKVRYSGFINTVAASTFGVLLIHANSEYMRQWLWKDLLNNVGMYSSSYLILHAVGSVLAIFAICTLIDFIRIKLIEKPFFILWDKAWNKISLWYQKTENKLCTKLNIDS
ncbi:MAG: acyltransferase [Clostridia bacterium]|nr:acyltransferase [Clostridia bacterium]